ncbi:unnamed protein product, partial [Urochloa humidicola]
PSTLSPFRPTRPLPPATCSAPPNLHPPQPDLPHARPSDLALSILSSAPSAPSSAPPLPLLLAPHRISEEQRQGKARRRRTRRGTGQGEAWSRRLARRGEKRPRQERRGGGSNFVPITGSRSSSPVAAAHPQHWRPHLIPVAGGCSSPLIGTRSVGPVTGGHPDLVMPKQPVMQAPARTKADLSLCHSAFSSQLVVRRKESCTCRHVVSLDTEEGRGSQLLASGASCANCSGLYP